MSATVLATTAVAGTMTVSSIFDSLAFMATIVGLVTLSPFVPTASNPAGQPDSGDPDDWGGYWDLDFDKYNSIFAYLGVLVLVGIWYVCSFTYRWFWFIITILRRFQGDVGVLIILVLATWLWKRGPFWYKSAIQLHQAGSEYRNNSTTSNTTVPASSPTVSLSSSIDSSPTIKSETIEATPENGIGSTNHDFGNSANTNSSTKQNNHVMTNPPNSDLSSTSSGKEQPKTSEVEKPTRSERKTRIKLREKEEELAQREMEVIRREQSVKEQLDLKAITKSPTKLVKPRSLSEIHGDTTAAAISKKRAASEQAVVEEDEWLEESYEDENWYTSGTNRYGVLDSGTERFILNNATSEEIQSNLVFAPIWFDMDTRGLAVKIENHDVLYELAGENGDMYVSPVFSTSRFRKYIQIEDKSIDLKTIELPVLANKLVDLETIISTSGVFADNTTVEYHVHEGSMRIEVVSVPKVNTGSHGGSFSKPAAPTYDKLDTSGNHTNMLLSIEKCERTFQNFGPDTLRAWSSFGVMIDGLDTEVMRSNYLIYDRVVKSGVPYSVIPAILDLLILKIKTDLGLPPVVESQVRLRRLREVKFENKGNQSVSLAAFISSYKSRFQQLMRSRKKLKSGQVFTLTGKVSGSEFLSEESNRIRFSTNSTQIPPEITISLGNYLRSMPSEKITLDVILDFYSKLSVEEHQLQGALQDYGVATDWQTVNPRKTNPAPLRAFTPNSETKEYHACNHPAELKWTHEAVLDECPEAPTEFARCTVPACKGRIHPINPATNKPCCPHLFCEKIGFRIRGGANIKCALSLDQNGMPEPSFWLPENREKRRLAAEEAKRNGAARKKAAAKKLASATGTVGQDNGIVVIPGDHGYDFRIDTTDDTKPIEAVEKQTTTTAKVENSNKGVTASTSQTNKPPPPPTGGVVKLPFKMLRQAKLFKSKERGPIYLDLKIGTDSDDKPSVITQAYLDGGSWVGCDCINSEYHKQVQQLQPDAVSDLRKLETPIQVSLAIESTEQAEGSLKEIMLTDFCYMYTGITDKSSRTHWAWRPYITVPKLSSDIVIGGETQLVEWRSNFTKIDQDILILHLEEGSSTPLEFNITRHASLGTAKAKLAKVAKSASKKIDEKPLWPLTHIGARAVKVVWLALSGLVAFQGLISPSQKLVDAGITFPPVLCDFPTNGKISLPVAFSNNEARDFNKEIFRSDFKVERIIRNQTAMTEEVETEVEQVQSELDFCEACLQDNSQHTETWLDQDANERWFYDEVFKGDFLETGTNYKIYNTPERAYHGAQDKDGSFEEIGHPTDFLLKQEEAFRIMGKLAAKQSKVKRTEEQRQQELGSRGGIFTYSRTKSEALRSVFEVTRQPHGHLKMAKYKKAEMKEPRTANEWELLFRNFEEKREQMRFRLSPTSDEQRSLVLQHWKPQLIEAAEQGLIHKRDIEPALDYFCSKSDQFFIDGNPFPQLSYVAHWEYRVPDHQRTLSPTINLGDYERRCVHEIMLREMASGKYCEYKPSNQQHREMLAPAFNSPLLWAHRSGEIEGRCVVDFSRLNTFQQPVVGENLLSSWITEKMRPVCGAEWNDISRKSFVGEMETPSLKQYYKDDLLRNYGDGEVSQYTEEDGKLLPSYFCSDMALAFTAARVSRSLSKHMAVSWVDPGSNAIRRAIPVRLQLGPSASPGSFGSFVCDGLTSYLRIGGRVYVDDLAHRQRGWKMHKVLLDEMFLCCSRIGVKLKLRKSFLGKQIDLLGSSSDGSLGEGPQASKLEQINDMADAVLNSGRPQRSLLHSYVAVTRYYSGYSLRVAEAAGNLNRIICNKEPWSALNPDDVNTLRTAVKESTKMMRVDVFGSIVSGRPIEVTIDASASKAAYAVFQRERPCARARVIEVRETLLPNPSWSVREREIFSLILFYRKFYKRIRGRSCVIYTDHRSLSNLELTSSLSKTGSDKISRWICELSPLLNNCPIVHITGSSNVLADWASRHSSEEERKTLQESCELLHATLPKQHLRSCQLVDAMLRDPVSFESQQYELYKQNKDRIAAFLKENDVYSDQDIWLKGDDDLMTANQDSMVYLHSAKDTKFDKPTGKICLGEQICDDETNSTGFMNACHVSENGSLEKALRDQDIALLRSAFPGTSEENLSLLSSDVPLRAAVGLNWDLGLGNNYNFTDVVMTDQGTACALRPSNNKLVTRIYRVADRIYVEIAGRKGSKSFAIPEGIGARGKTVVSETVDRAWNYLTSRIQACRDRDEDGVPIHDKTMWYIPKPSRYQTLNPRSRTFVNLGISTGFRDFWLEGEPPICNECNISRKLVRYGVKCTSYECNCGKGLNGDTIMADVEFTLPNTIVKASEEIEWNTVGNTSQVTVPYKSKWANIQSLAIQLFDYGANVTLVRGSDLNESSWFSNMDDGVVIAQLVQDNNWRVGPKDAWSSVEPDKWYLIAHYVSEVFYDPALLLAESRIVAGVDSIKAAQANDTYLSNLINFIKSKELVPTPFDDLASSIGEKLARRIFAEAKHFALDCGILVRTAGLPFGNNLVVIPQAWEVKFIDFYHSKVHHTATATYALMIADGFWAHNLLRKISTRLSRCDQCLHSKYPSSANKNLRHYVNEATEHINGSLLIIDHLGPLPSPLVGKSSSSNSKKKEDDKQWYVFVARDFASLYPYLRPAHGKDDHTTCEILKEISQVHSGWKYVRSDRGFGQYQLQSLMQMAGIRSRLITSIAWSPQSQWVAESSNPGITKALTVALETTPNSDWRPTLELYEYFLKITPVSALGHRSPIQKLFNISGPTYYMPRVNDEIGELVDTWNVVSRRPEWLDQDDRIIEKLSQQIAADRALVTTKQKHSQPAYKDLYKVGDILLVLKPPEPGKLRYKFRPGLFQVISTALSYVVVKQVHKLYEPSTFRININRTYRVGFKGDFPDLMNPEVEGEQDAAPEGVWSNSPVQLEENEMDDEQDEAQLRELAKCASNCIGGDRNYLADNFVTYDSYDNLHDVD